jgi:outer membrane lipoprotein LolB
LRYCKWLLPALLVLEACSSTGLKVSDADSDISYQDRAEKLALIRDWSLVGRISLADGKDGGSGRLQWVARDGLTELDFHGAMGRGAWNLQIEPTRAVLREANGSVQSAVAVDDLIQQRMGWPIPVDALQWWVRGLAAPGEIDELLLDSTGVPVKLAQFGWNVDFKRFDSDSGLSLPTRLDARRDNYRVKLAVSTWLMGDNVKNR